MKQEIDPKYTIQFTKEEKPFMIARDYDEKKVSQLNDLGPSYIDYLKEQEKPIMKPLINLLLLGTSGAGKTTFINAGMNHYLGRGYFEEKLIAIPSSGLKCNIEKYQNHSNERVGAGMSKTQQCYSYEVESATHNINFMDTPGAGDTSGEEVDVAHRELIIEEVKNKFDFNAICLIHKATENRVGPALKYYISEIKTMLPSQCKNNFIICLTHSTTGDYTEALEILKSLDINVENCLYFENYGVYKNTNPVNEYYWKNAKEAYDKLGGIAAAMTPFASEEFQKVAQERSAFIREMNAQIESQEYFERVKIAYNKKMLEVQECKKQMKPNIKIIEVPRYIPNPKDGKDTKCGICNFTCHKNCHLCKTVTEKGNSLIDKCNSMFKASDRNRCKICGHISNDHYHEPHSFVITKMKVTVYDPKIEKAGKKAAKKKAVLEKELEEDKKNVIVGEEQEKAMLSKIAATYMKVKSMSLLPFNDHFEGYMNFVIKNLLKAPKTELNSKKLVQLNATLALYLKQKDLVAKVK